MKQNYSNKAKHRSAWFALVLLMLTALPSTAQNVGERFQVGELWYEVVDATTEHTVKVTYANDKAATPEATRQVLDNATAELPNEWKGYNGTLKTNAVDKNGKKVETMKDELAYELATGQIYTITIPDKVNYNDKDWTVTAIGSYAFINERRIRKMELPATIEAIEDAAFYQCSVTLLNFPTSLKYIGWGAFYKSNLAPFYLKEYKGGNPAKKGTWERKPGTAVDIPGSTAIGPQAFEGSFSTSKFKCPNITFVGYQAFKGAKIDITTAIPATAKIGEQPEDNKIKVMYKNLPAGTDQRSGVESFAEFSGTVSLAEGPTTIPTGMFEKAFTNLANFFIPLSVVNSIDERAFSNAGILSFNALSEVKRIGARAFENGVISGDFVIRDQVEEVGDGAFAGNIKLEAFILKGSANCKIGAGILKGCPNLEYVDLRNVKNEDFKKNLKNLSREFNSHTITSGLPTHTLVFLPEATDITIADGQDVNFIKSDGTCTKLSLQDGMEYEFLCDIKANQAVYNRCNMTINKKTIDRGYNTALAVARYEGDNSLTSYRDFSKFADGKHCFTIFLPYAVTLPTGIRAYELKYKNKKAYFTDGQYLPEQPEYPYGWPSDTEFYVFNSIPDGSTLEASKPYLLRITDGNSHTFEKFTANNVEITKSPEKFDIVNGGRLKPVGFPATSSEQSYSFQGSTEMIPPEAYKDDKNRPWVLNIATKNTINGFNQEIDVWKQMLYADKSPGVISPSIPPFRGFVNLLPGASGAKKFMVLDEGKTTGISDVTNDADAQQGAQRIYTMDGRYVGTNFDSLPSGMYIMKGKKTLKTK